MKWAFVDFENVGSLEALKDSDYARIFVFCGPKNTKISLDDVPAAGTCRFEMIRVITIGSNNLDFHLAFYLGKFHQTVEPKIAFDIVSNDNGFNGLIKHIKSLGRSCKKVTSKNTKPKTPKQKSPAETLSTLIKDLKKIEDRSRPASEEKLLSWIQARIPSNNGSTPEMFCEKLKKEGKIEVTENGIRYHV